MQSSRLVLPRPPQQAAAPAGARLRGDGREGRVDARRGRGAVFHHLHARVPLVLQLELGQQGVDVVLAALGQGTGKGWKQAEGAGRSSSVGKRCPSWSHGAASLHRPARHASAHLCRALHAPPLLLLIPLRLALRLVGARPRLLPRLLLALIPAWRQHGDGERCTCGMLRCHARVAAGGKQAAGGGGIAAAHAWTSARSRWHSVSSFDRPLAAGGSGSGVRGKHEQAAFGPAR